MTQPALLSRDQLTAPAHLDLSSVRLLKVPDVAPPFDGEVLPARVTARAAFPRGGARRAGQARGQATAADPRPPARADDWTQQFAQLLVETLAGARPLRQLLPWLTDRARVHLRRVEPVLRCGQRPRVLRVHASRPIDNVVEMSVIVGLGSRTRALAVRLEEAVRAGQPARWLCTDIETA